MNFESNFYELVTINDLMPVEFASSRKRDSIILLSFHSTETRKHHQKQSKLSDLDRSS
mgnify:CR=1 FL=1